MNATKSGRNDRRIDPEPVRSGSSFFPKRRQSVTENLYDGFARHDLDGRHDFYSGRLPEDLRLTTEQFGALWDMHPEEYQTIMIHGRPVKVPRWQYAFGVGYFFSGVYTEARPVPAVLAPLLAWVQAAIDP